MRKTVLRALTITVVLSPGVVFTQSGAKKVLSTTFITKEEIDTVNSQGQGTDRNIKTVDIGHENFQVGIIHRIKTVEGVQAQRPGASAALPAGGAAAPAAPAATCGRQMATLPPGGMAGGITHDSQTEGYYIISGGGTMITEGYIVNGRYNLSPDLNGPTCSGVAYDAIKTVVKTGDVIIVPPNVVHGWWDIPDHVDYLSFRPSPGILTAGFVHPTIKK